MKKILAIALLLLMFSCAKKMPAANDNSLLLVVAITEDYMEIWASGGTLFSILPLCQKNFLMA